MCGRFFVVNSPEAVRSAFGYVEQPNFPPRDNIAPTEPVAVIRQENGARHFNLMRWGFMPGWVKDPSRFPLVINIRSETAAEKPSFRAALKHRHALIPADGFYEWKTEGKTKIQHAITRSDGQMMALAALWETWTSPDGGEIDTVAILTQQARGAIASLHERMPVMLAPEQWDAWLDPFDGGKATMGLIHAAPDVDWTIRAMEKKAGAQKPVAATKPSEAREKSKKSKPDQGQGSLFD